MKENSSQTAGQSRRRIARKKLAIQTTVGIFVISGLLLVGYMMVKIGKVSIVGGESYPLFARFTSVSGLRLGSAVEIAGIKIGQVEKLTIDQEEQAAVVELKLRKDIKVFEDATAAIVTAGLIGEKFVMIDPGSHGQVLQPNATITDTEPTVEKLALDKVLNQTLRAAEGIDLLVRSPELMEAIRSVNKAMNASRILVRNVDKRVVPLVSNIEGAVRDTRQLVQNMDNRLVPLATKMEETSTAVRAASEQVGRSFVSLEQTLEGDSVLGYTLRETLNDLSAAARSIRVLTDYLERHPESVLFGKRG